MNYSEDSGSQSEVLYDSRVTVRFTGVYDLYEDKPHAFLVGTGRTVDEAWVDACNALCREVEDCTYDDWTAA